MTDDLWTGRPGAGPLPEPVDAEREIKFAICVERIVAAFVIAGLAIGGALLRGA